MQFNIGYRYTVPDAKNCGNCCDRMHDMHMPESEGEHKKLLQAQMQQQIGEDSLVFNGKKQTQQQTHFPNGTRDGKTELVGVMSIHGNSEVKSLPFQGLAKSQKSSSDGQIELPLS